MILWAIQNIVHAFTRLLVIDYSGTFSMTMLCFFVFLYTHTHTHTYTCVCVLWISAASPTLSNSAFKSIHLCCYVLHFPSCLILVLLIQEVLVRFAGFGPEEDEWVNVRKHVRQRSLPCESSECVAVLPGDLILCFQVHALNLF